MAWWDNPSWTPQLPTAKPAGAVSGHWRMPDWSQLLRGDPGAIAARAALEGGTTIAGQGRTSAIRQALLKWGIVPKALTDPSLAAATSEAADPATLAAAAADPNTVAAQLQAQLGRGRQDTYAQLAARGILSSGALTGGEQMQQNAYEGNLRTETNKLLEALGGAQGAYTGRIGELEGAWGTALGEAGGRVSAGNQPTWEEDPTVAPPSPPPEEDPATTAVIARSAGLAADPNYATAGANLFKAPPPLLTQQQFAKIRPKGNYQRYRGYVTQKRAQRAR
jgi:hypothetical protein